MTAQGPKNAADVRMTFAEAGSFSSSVNPHGLGVCTTGVPK
jgi:hypothetical protein